MKKLVSGFICLGILTIAYTLNAQVAPAIEWSKCYGGSSIDEANCIRQTADNGFIVAGLSYSNDWNVTINHGSADYWIVKLDSDGNIVWQKSYGGTGDDEAESVDQTTDGGYIVVGYSNSNNGDVSGNHGDYDYWVIRLDADGNLLWEKSFGSLYSDFGRSVQQLSDGNIIVAGYNGPSGTHNYWILKLDDSGSELWTQSYGGTNEDYALSILQTGDGGLIVGGDAVSSNGDVIGNHGGADEWILKLDANGSVQWKKCFGGSNSEQTLSLKQSSDGGYFVAGFSMSNDGDVTGNNGAHDYWITKIDGNGNLIWQKPLGGSAIDIAVSIDTTNDGGCIVAGYAASSDGDVYGNHSSAGSYDYWLIRFNSQGDTLWTKCLGGTSNDAAYAIQKTIDCGYVVAGYADSQDGDVTGNHGSEDFWIVKLSCDGFPTASVNLNQQVSHFSLSPNPVLTQLTINLAMTVSEVSINVYDLQGRRIEIPTIFSKIETQLNTASLVDGFYVLQITNNKTGEREVGKFVKKF